MRPVIVVPKPPVPPPPSNEPTPPRLESPEPTHLIDSAEIQEVVEDPRDAHPLAPELREPLTLAELAEAFDAPSEEPMAPETASDRNRSSMRKLLDKLFESES